MSIRILDSFGPRPDEESLYLNAISSFQSSDCNIVGVNHRKKLDITRAWSPFELDTLYRQKNAKLLRWYDEVWESCDDFDVLIVNHENPYHPDFISRLSEKIYTVLYTGDDPEASYLCSQPYAWAFDHVQCYAVYYDAATPMKEKLMSWGAKRASHRAHGFMPHRVGLKEDVIASVRSGRDIDLIYVGGPYNKVDSLLKLKKHFGANFKIYGAWGGVRASLARYKRYGVFTNIKPISDRDLLSIYTRSKLGINMHMSFGPSNLRMWELPINGVAQVTDNPTGTALLWDVDSEIACYANDNIDEAIEKIEFYLCNDENRIEMAIRGYDKAKAYYSFESCFLRGLSDIKLGMDEKNAKLGEKQSSLWALQEI